ncbi:acetylglutamate kinase [Desulfovibrio sp. OttesenSCG-928-A18]|nr:acetylglutamate kinase [Desulfovibrio sp. OttesenSCG-928-A18]
MSAAFESNVAQARMLIESLPYIRQFRGEVVVVKYGGHAMKDETLKRSFALNIALLKYVGVRPVIVHGGGPQIGGMLQQLHIESSFREGLRVTDDATMDVVEMVLVGKVNKEIVSGLNRAGASAVGLSGKDGQLIRARKMEMVLTSENRPPEIIDLGRVGEVMGVDTGLLNLISREDYVPVIAPTGVDEEGGTYNINADAVAGAVAAALKARRLLLLTDVPGILDRGGQLIKTLSMNETWELFADGTLKGGMIPKVKCCLEALQEGVEKAMIIDGRVENCILLELFTDAGIGTEIVGPRAGSLRHSPPPQAEYRGR